MRELPMRSPNRPCTSAATAHAIAAAVEPEPRPGRREAVVLDEQVRHVDLGAEERSGDESAHQHDARQSPSGDERAAAAAAAGRRGRSRERMPRPRRPRTASSLSRETQRAALRRPPRRRTRDAGRRDRTTDARCSSGVPHSVVATMMKATTVRPATPRKTQRQCRYSVTAPARNGPDERGDHPRRRERGEHPAVQRGRVDAGDDDVQRDGLPARAEPLHEPPDDEDLHRGREPRHDEPVTNSATDTVSGHTGPERSLHAPTATIPMTLVASVPAKAIAYSAAPSRSSLTTGMTVVTASDCIAARKISATAPAVTQTKRASQTEAGCATSALTIRRGRRPARSPHGAGPESRRS